MATNTQLDFYSAPGKFKLVPIQANKVIFI